MRRRVSPDQLLWTIFFVVLIAGGGLWVVRSWQRAYAPRERSQAVLPVLEFVTFTPAPTSVLDEDGRTEISPTLTLTATLIPTGTITVTPVLTPGPNEE